MLYDVCGDLGTLAENLLTIRSSGVSSRKKLTGPNFIDWYRQLRIVLSIKDKLNYLEQPIPLASVVPAVQHVAPEILAAHTAWIKGSKEIVGLMLITMEPDIQRNLKNLHAREMLLELKTLFAQQAEHELLQTTRDFHSCKQEEGLLHKEFDGFVQNYNMHSPGKTINEFHAMLKLHEQNLPKNNALALHAIRVGKVQKVNKHKKSQPQMASRGQNHGKGKNKQAYAPKPKIPPPPKREDPAKDSICHECALGAGGLGIFVIELYTILNRSWIYDTGNGQREAVEAIGIFYLCLPIGLEIVLNNCHYAPSITRGVISVSCLYEDGFISRFVNNIIQVSRNNMVYFSAIPKDGIFEIDLSNSYTNESSIYVVSNKRAKLDLDSALLWHCCLGHISKKRIKKLQHDGLLNSTDLRAFEKCVSCMSRKMARKPYTNQVERAKDLLGLIHTDVCGPFKTMSRQGASYFVTFTDDCSRYGYVYLLKHKHKVFETFKVFQKEVENQLGKIIKSPCSDCEGEYMSQEFLDHLKDHGIIAHRTPPYTPHHNGVSERRNKTLLDMVLVELPPNGKTVGSKWLFKKKTDMDGVVHTYKARFVAKGYTQTLGINYDETFSPVADIRAIKILIAIRYCMENSNRGSIPMQEKLQLSKSQGASTPAEVKRTQNVLYASVVGSIIGDLKGELRLSYYTDAGYLTDDDNLKSQTGYVFVLNGGVVD
nr:retrotransposon protein, putative, Ty1-copia subclass [Tanacetum cinerariifolium]